MAEDSRNYILVKKYILNLLKTNLSSKYVYHSLTHTKEILHFTIKISNMEKVSYSDLILLKTAALYHDTGFLFSQNEHEKFSSQFAKLTLPNFNYSPEEIEIISGLILSTKLPQKPVTHLQEIICDADLMNLGNDTFFRKNRLLRKELENLGHYFSDKNWTINTFDFLSNHNFFTRSAQKLSKNFKEDNKLKVQKHLKLIT